MDLSWLTVAPVSGALLIFMGAAIVLLRRRRKHRASAIIPLEGRVGFSGRLGKLFRRSDVDAAFWEELEQVLLEADVGVAMTEKLLSAARDARNVDEARDHLAQEMRALLNQTRQLPDAMPRVSLVVGVNGVGKTTTIAKLAHQRMEAGEKVLLVAGDTFRAAAIEQLAEWAGRLGCEVVAQKPGADAAAVAFDGIEKAMAKGFDAVIIDTAGRLHTKQNLMEELKKMRRVIGRAMPDAPHETLLVMDATVGSNGLTQARQFHEAMGVSGVVMTKLDGTAKGGIVLAVAGELGLPIAHIGVGERLEDLRYFNAEEFVSAILGGEIQT